MPICKNTPKKHYTGNEPSPKGLGYYFLKINANFKNNLYIF